MGQFVHFGEKKRAIVAWTVKAERDIIYVIKAQRILRRQIGGIDRGRIKIITYSENLSKRIRSS